MTAAELLAAHVASLTWDGLPDGARSATRVFLLDTLAVGMAGARAPFADAVLAASGGAAGEAPVFGRARRLDRTATAFVNGFQIHAQEFDCVHEPAVVHPMAAIVAALCAAADGIDGARFGAALVGAVDVAVALGLAARTPLKFFRPATAGIFGAAAGVARLRGLDAAGIAAAIGHALCFAAGTMQAHGEGMPGLPLQIANAARAAVTAAALAEAGVPAVREAIEGPFGYLRLFEDGSDLEPVLGQLGAPHRIEEVSHKPFPTGRAAHGGIVALREALAGGLATASITRIEYVAPPLIARLVGRPALPGMRANYARLCLPYLLGVVATRGTVGLEDFTEERLADPAVLDFAGRVTVTADGNPDPAAFVPATLRVTRGSETIDHPVTALLGSPARTLSVAEREAKARACCAFAGAPERGDALVAAAMALDGATRMTDLLALTAGPG